MTSTGRNILAGWWLAARLARREVRRRPLRTALVTALIALPVTGMVLAIVLLRTGELSKAEYWRFDHGRADAYVTNGVAPALPAGGRSVAVVRQAEVIVTTADERRCRCDLSDLPLDDPLADGIVRITSGREPRAADEILLTESAASDLRVGLGDTVQLRQPIAEAVSVVGFGLDNSSRGGQAVVFGPGADFVATQDANPPSVEHLVDLPDGMTIAEVLAWEEQTAYQILRPGLIAHPRAVHGAEDNANVGVRWSWVGGAVGLLVLGVVVTAAFAASARRQLATLGQLAANGATPATLRRVLFLQGTWSGVVGAGAGLLLGAAALSAVRPHAESYVGHAILGYDVRFLDLAPLVLLAVAAATIAAMVPAFGASRVSVLTALAGRRPLGRVSRRVTVAGFLLAVAGLAMLSVALVQAQDESGPGSAGRWTLVAIGGAVALLLGTCMVAPAYVSTLRLLAHGLRGPSRLAARSLTRQRTRTSALVAAVAATAALAVAAATYGLGVQVQNADDHLLTDLPRDLVSIRPSRSPGDIGAQPTPSEAAVDDVVAQVAAELAAPRRHDISEAVPAGVNDNVRAEFSPVSFEPDDPDDLAPEDSDAFGGWPFGLPARATVVDDEFLAAYDLDERMGQALDVVGAVLVAPASGRAVVQVGTATPATFPAQVVEPSAGHLLGTMNDLLISPRLAVELGLGTRRAEVVLRTPQPLTADERSAIHQVVLGPLVDLPTTGAIWVDRYTPGLYVSAPQIEAGFTAVATLIALFVVAAGLALAAAETRDERDVLSLLGASPRSLRRTSARKAGLLTLLGGALAIPVGVLPVAVFTRVDEEGLPFVVPWRMISVLVVAMPLVVSLATSMATRLSLRLRPVTVSTVTFE